MDGDTTKAMNWIRSLYKYLTPHVTKKPRTAYVNYNDLALGVNNQNGPTSYSQASKWVKSTSRIILIDWFKWSHELILITFSGTSRVYLRFLIRVETFRSEVLVSSLAKKFIDLFIGLWPLNTDNIVIKFLNCSIYSIFQFFVLLIYCNYGCTYKHFVWNFANYWNINCILSFACAGEYIIN